MKYAEPLLKRDVVKDGRSTASLLPHQDLALNSDATRLRLDQPPKDARA